MSDGPSTNIILTSRKEVAVAGTAERLTSASVPCKELVITAETNNTGVICVGNVDVVAAVGTRKGTPLVAGASVVLSIADAYSVYLDTTVNTDGVTFNVMGG